MKKSLCIAKHTPHKFHQFHPKAFKGADLNIHQINSFAFLRLFCRIRILFLLPLFKLHIIDSRFFSQYPNCSISYQLYSFCMSSWTYCIYKDRILWNQMLKLKDTDSFENIFLHKELFIQSPFQMPYQKNFLFFQQN